MAVRLPSDLVADVMRNADPVRRNAAVARLQSMESGGAAFAEAVDRATGSTFVGHDFPPSMQEVGRNALPHAGRDTDHKKVAYRGFEQMVLRNLFETLMPSESSGAFGGGPSAGVWRSMAADQLASVTAGHGGIGIARMLASSDTGAAPQRDAQWPYFSLHTLRAAGSAG